MFAREAAAYARLSHPSIVRLYDFFANDDQLVMVLEYIDGPPLSQLRGMLKAVGQQLDDATAIYVASSIFEALAAAHGATDDTGEPAPVIHRDVNPSNVLIPWDGHVKLADFGVAKVTGASHQSSVGLIRGTFGYMAPEQVKGETRDPACRCLRRRDHPLGDAHEAARVHPRGASGDRGAARSSQSRASSPSTSFAPISTSAFAMPSSERSSRVPTGGPSRPRRWCRSCAASCPRMRGARSSRGRSRTCGTSRTPRRRASLRRSP